MNNKILYVIIIILFILLLIDKSCRKPNKSFKQIETYIDTIKTTDTIWAKDTIYKFKTIRQPKATDSIFVHDTMLIKQLIPDYVDCTYLRVYNDSAWDENIILYYTDTIFGILFSKNMSYKLKVPLIINNNTIINKKSKFSLYTGIEAGGNKQTFNLSPYVLINHKKNQYFIRYDLVNKTTNIGLGIRILQK